MILEITKNDIIKGNSGEADSCAIALALRKKFKTAQVEVSYSFNNETGLATSYDIFVRDKKYCLPLSKDRVKFVRFMNNFDDSARRKFCRPMTLRLEKVN